MPIGKWNSPGSEPCLPHSPRKRGVAALAGTDATKKRTHNRKRVLHMASTLGPFRSKSCQPSVAREPAARQRSFHPNGHTHALPQAQLAGVVEDDDALQRAGVVAGEGE